MGLFDAFKKPEKELEQFCGILVYDWHDGLKVLLGRYDHSPEGDDKNVWCIPNSRLYNTTEANRNAACWAFMQDTGLSICGSVFMPELKDTTTKDGRKFTIFGMMSEDLSGMDKAKFPKTDDEHDDFLERMLPKRKETDPKIQEIKYFDAEYALKEIVHPYHRIFIKRLIIYRKFDEIDDIARSRGTEKELADELNAWSFNFDSDEDFDPMTSVYV